MRKVQLNDICELIVDCPHSTAVDEGDGYPLVRTPNIGKGRLIYQGMHRVSEAVYLQRNKRATPQEDDLIFAREATAGNVALIQRDEKVCLGQRTVLIRPNKSIVNPAFLTYYLLAPMQQYNLLSTANGSTVAHVNLPTIRNLKLELPELYIQRRIASILSAYDNLIENNTRRIRLLEQMAENIYKEWFVRFRFPGHENAEFENGLPKGWQLRHIGDVCDTIGGGTPSTSKPEYWGGDIKWVTPTDITSKDSLPLLTIAGRITQEGLNKSSAKLLPPYTILMTSRASIGFFGMAPFEVCTNQGFISIIPHSENLRMYMLYMLKSRKEEIVMNANGSTFLEISKGRFRKMRMLIPDDLTLNKFEKRARAIFDTVMKLEQQSMILARQRDLLLPRLMSGKLEVKG